jgi:hypothetical protein
MTATTDAASTSALGWRRAILFGGLAVGVLDGLDAVIAYGLLGAAPHRVFQGVAAGLLGRESFRGGPATAVLGLALHFVIAFAVVAAYVAVSRRLESLWRRPVLWGLVYGVFVFFFMSHVVVPLSAAGSGAFSLPLFLNGVIGHALLVGLPSALAARAAWR